MESKFTGLQLAALVISFGQYNNSSSNCDSHLLTTSMVFSFQACTVSCLTLLFPSSFKRHFIFVSDIIYYCLLITLSQGIL